MRSTTLIVATTAAAILSGCAFKSMGKDAAVAARAEPASAVLLLDSKPAHGKSRDEFFQELAEAARAQQVEVSTTSTMSRFPIPNKKPDFLMKESGKPATHSLIPSFLSGSTKELTCENAVLTIHGANADATKTGAKGTLVICVSQYNGGYRTGVQASIEKSSIPLTSLFRKQSTIDSDRFVSNTLSAVRSVVERNTAGATEIHSPLIPQ